LQENIDMKNNAFTSVKLVQISEAVSIVFKEILSK